QLFDHDCLNGTPTGELASCPPSPKPLVQVTTGPGTPDNPSTTIRGDLVAFDADGAHAGGVGPGVGRRQIFIRNMVTSALTRVTDVSTGDSTRPSLDERGRHLVFETTAPLLGGPAGVSQIYLYDIAANTLKRLTTGAGPSTAPMLTKLGRLAAFESTADLLGDGHDTGVSQIFWWDAIDGSLHQLTNGNGPSRRPYVSYRLRSALKKTVGRGAAIAFESSATNLPNTAGGPGTQVYIGNTRAGNLPPLHQLTPAPIAGCTPGAPGDSTAPAFDAFGRRIAFISTGDFLCNGTSGRRVFVLDPRRLPATLFQLNGRGDTEGPLVGSMGHWFVGLSTTDDLTGQGVCGHQLQVIDFFTGHWQPASTLGEVPFEPAEGSPDGGCDDGDACTTDSCIAGTCLHAAILGCP
ncbi:MAG TPA: hypothetical protein VKA21_04165, partial [Candidatus Binatia bacterium]|nr:hypothetical protein [Candidatus Binatia bacterium]